MEKFIETAFHTALQEKGKEIAERLGKEYTERFNKELNEAVMNIALNVSREVSIERMGDDLRITLRDARQS